MKVAIIGAGPAGIYLSLFLRNFSGEVVLFDQNKKIGEKLRITGGGRMNVTNKVFGVDQFSSYNERQLKRLFKSPWVKNRYDLFEELEVEYNWEGDRAILKSGNAIEEVERLNKKIVQQKNLTLSLNSKVLKVEKKSQESKRNSQEKTNVENFLYPGQSSFESNNDPGSNSSFLENNLEGNLQEFSVTYEKDGNISQEFFDVVVFSGGAMFRLFDLKLKEKIYELPTSFDHSITDVFPSLSPLKVPNHRLKELSGISFEATLKNPGNKNYCINNVLITHVGISGPVCLDFSALKTSDDIEMSFLPHVNEEQFSQEFSELRQGKNLLRKFLLHWLPKRLVDWHISEIGEDVSVNIADISKEKLKNLKRNLFHFELKDTQSFGYNYCWTTKGGVDLTQVNVATLESKKIPGIYFAGEILDVNGLCGGYNISFAAISAKIVSEDLMKNS